MGLRLSVVASIGGARLSDVCAGRRSVVASIGGARLYEVMKGPEVQRDEQEEPSRSAQTTSRQWFASAIRTVSAESFRCNYAR